MARPLLACALAVAALSLSIPSLSHAHAGRRAPAYAGRPAFLASPARQPNSTPGVGFVIPVAPATLTASVTPVARATVTPTTIPTPAPSSLLPLVYYQNGRGVYAVNHDGGGKALVATMPASTTVRPQLLPDGRLLYPTNATGSTFAAVDRFGRLSGIRTPGLYAGETVWSVTPAPDGRSLAWQLFAPLHIGRYPVNTGVGRVVLTGRFGEGGATIFTTRADSRYGAVQVALGWRPSSPYGSGRPTLLLQDLYGSVDPADGVGFNTMRGLLEYDPAIADLVGDYLPPLTSDVPPQRALTVSADGVWTVYGDANSFTPSGDGPLARVLGALNLNTNRVVALDTAGHYPTTRALTTTHRRKAGKRVVTTRVRTGTLRLYQYFSHNAYVAPGDARVLYTVLTVSYPRGALVPQVQHSAEVATLDGKHRTAVAPGEAQGEGWLDGHTAVIARAGGLYSVDINKGTTTKLVGGAPARLFYIGVRRK